MTKWKNNQITLMEYRKRYWQAVEAQALGEIMTYRRMMELWGLGSTSVANFCVSRFREFGWLPEKQEGKFTIVFPHPLEILTVNSAFKINNNFDIFTIGTQNEYGEIVFDVHRNNTLKGMVEALMVVIRGEGLVMEYSNDGD